MWAAQLPYKVQFYGLPSSSVLSDLKASSELLQLQERPPASVNGLQYRVKADLPNLMHVLKAYAYFDARISYDIQSDGLSATVSIFIEPGRPYILHAYEIVQGDCKQPLDLGCGEQICLEDLDLRLGAPADAMSILRAETALLNALGRYGYPLAYIDKRRVIADMEAKDVDAAVCVQTGSLAKFGPSTLFGLKSVSPRFIEHKIAWKEGEVFDSDLIDETQRRLLKSDLFTSVLVSNSEELDDAGEVAMKLRLSESKHRSLSLGVSYATQDGFGGMVSWTNRNVRGMGELLNFEAEASQLYIQGAATYKKPDFLVFDQTLGIMAAASRESIRPYLAFTYAQANQIERRVDPHRSYSIGLKGEYITVHKSANDGTFFLLGMPLHGTYTTSNSPLDATQGYTFFYGATPYQSLRNGGVRFVRQEIAANLYAPLMPKDKVVLALHGFLGSVAGTAQENVPLPKLFLGGSEDNLRGYDYKTVSPLNSDGKPLGGRSAIFATIELRLRVTESIGLVPFADFGTVSLSEWPDFTAKWLKSVGFGIRYFSFFGPLRLDVGFPLNPRKDFETWGKVYASVGQSF